MSEPEWYRSLRKGAVSVAITAGYPARQKDQWSESPAPGTNSGSAAPSEGRVALPRKAATHCRTRERSEARPTKQRKSPVEG